MLGDSRIYWALLIFEVIDYLPQSEKSVCGEIAIRSSILQNNTPNTNMLVVLNTRLEKSDLLF